MTVAPYEIKCSLNQNLGVILRAARLELEAGREVVFSGLGAAMASCVTASGRLVKDNVGKVVKLETNTLTLKGNNDQDRQVPQLRVFMQAQI